MDPQPAAQVFQVRFSAPSVLARLVPQPKQHWKLSGSGEISIEDDQVVLRGQKSREVPIPRADILNVVQEGSVVQCQVNFADRFTVLKVWAADEESAAKLVQALPTRRTAQFDQKVQENSSFNQDLAGLGTRALVTPALLVLNCVVFACTVYAGAGFFDANGALLVQWGTNYGPRTLDGQWWRLFTAMFLHFGVLHLALNMWALWSIGRLTERLYGSAYFIVLYLFSGLCGSFASLYVHPALNSAGASGAIFGVLGGLFAFMVNPKTRIPASIAATHRNSAIVFIAYNLFNGFSHAGIDNAAHLGGLAGGIAMGWLLARPVKFEARQSPMPRLALAMLAGIVVLGVLAWPLVHTSPTVAAERSFRHQFQLSADDEEQANAALLALNGLLSSHKITQTEWGSRIATQIVPRWQAAEDRLSQVALPPGARLAPLHDLSVAYFDQKRMALQLLSEAARDNDGQKVMQATRLSAQSKAKLAQIQTLWRQAD
jgi:rhomboid protease GluP